MPQERVELGPKHLKLAIEAAESGQYSQTDPLTLQDTRVRNLQIRVQKSTATWIVRYNGRTLSLGPLNEIHTATAARETAQTVVLMLKQGQDPKAYILERRKGVDTFKAQDIAREKAAYAPGSSWTWEQLATRYVEEYLSVPRTVAKVARQPSQKSIAAARRYLLLPAHDHMRGKRIDALRARDLETARDRAFNEISPTASKKVVAYASAALTWAKRFYKDSSGLEDVMSWWKEIESRYDPPARERYLTVDQIARLLYRVELHRVADRRRVRRKTSDAIICALWWLVLTAQRTGTSMQLKRTHLVPDRDAEGWWIAVFPAENMKSRRYHALPIPPRVALLFERIKESSGRPSIWAFPSERKISRKTDEAADLHLSDNSVGQMIARLRGKRARGKTKDNAAPALLKKAPPRDLLAGIPIFSPHDLRRSLATILTDLKVRGDASSAILDHVAAVPGATAFAEAPVTRLVYNQSQKLALKREAMQVWTDAIFEACDKAWKPLPNSIPINPDLIYAIKPWYRVFEEKQQLGAAKRKGRGIDLKKFAMEVPGEGWQEWWEGELEE